MDKLPTLQREFVVGLKPNGFLTVVRNDFNNLETIGVMVYIQAMMEKAFSEESDDGDSCGHQNED